MPALETASPVSDLPRKLGLLDSLSIVVGIVIGGGIFLVPNLVAQELKSIPVILAVWIFAGIVSFFGALACAELGAMLPSTGGQYVFLRESYGPLVGFLCGWSNFLVARTAQVAWLAVTLALYLSYFVPLSGVASKLLGLGAIAVFTAINYWGATAAAFVQKIFTAAKVAGLLLIIGSALLFGSHHAATVAPVNAGFTLGGFGVALIACVMAYDGWVQLSFVAGEIRNPRRNILLALAMGTAICILIYVLANIAYLRVMSIPEIAASSHVGADAAGRVLGSAGGKLVSLIILMSIIGTLNGCFLTSPRVYFAQARDGLFFRSFAKVHPRHETPGFSIVAQGIWAAALLLSGSYESLIDYAMFGLWLSYGAMVAGLIVLRVKRPELPRPYRMWGYPVTPVLFLAITLWFLGNMLMTRPVPSLIGLGLTLAGIPVYFIWAVKEVAPVET
ncbi:MAG TPA: amino acid permease [Candidatus Sulfotelmatobacter sp.]|jgi:APA family basic amino acid/polyamine antiporter|nr:amino acid permease [Candidatus Sulfotelmatobacter sp.]